MDHNSNMHDLTSGSIVKKLLFFAIPLFIGSVFQQLYNIVDSIVVGNILGKQALAAVGTIAPVFFIMISLTMGLALGSSVVISQYFGAKDSDNMSKAAGTTYILIIISSAILVALGLVFTNQILNFMNVPDDIFTMTKLYLQIFILGLPMMTGYNFISGIFQGIGDSRTPLYLLIVATIVNIILDLVFVLIFGWGVGGVALATVIAQTFSFLLSLIFINKLSPDLALRKNNLTFNKRIAKKILYIGMPAALQNTVYAACVFFLQGIINSYGSTIIASHTAAMRVDSLFVAFYLTIGNVVTTFTGQNIGAAKLERVKEGTKVSTYILILISFVSSILIYFGGALIISVFNQDKEVIDFGARILKVIAPFYIFDGLALLYSSVFRGAGASIAALVISLIQTFLRIPAAYLFLYLFNDPIGIWVSMPFSWVVAAILCLFYYRWGSWQNKSLVKSKTSPIPEVY